jgi:hypothetical protein
MSRDSQPCFRFPFDKSIRRPDLGRIARVSDIFIPRSGIWVSDYPYLRRDEFEAVSRRLDSGDYEEPEEYEEPYDEFEYEEPPRRRDESPRRSERLTSDRYDAPRRSSYEASWQEDEYDEPEYEARPRKRIPKTGANGSDLRRDNRSTRRNPRPR